MDQPHTGNELGGGGDDDDDDEKEIEDEFDPVCLAAYERQSLIAAGGDRSRS